MPSALGAVSRVEALVARIHDRIADRDWAPGIAVTEATLVAEFGISRPTARSAIAAAVNLGLLTQEPNKAAVVPLITGPGVRDVFRIWIALELEAVRMLASHEVALRPSVRNAAESVTKHAEMTPRAFAEGELRFHRELFASADSPQLAYHWSLLERPILLAVVQGSRDLNAAAAHGDHLSVVHAIEAQDEERARSATHEHLERTREDLAFRLTVGAWGVRRGHASAE